MGVTVNSPKEIFIGAPGVVKFRTVDLGATTGGITVRIRPTIFTPQLNGIPGMLAMTDYLQTEEVEVELSLAELSQANLLAVLAGSTANANVITRTGNRRYPSSMYGPFQIQWAGLDSNTLEFNMALATCISGLELTAADDAAAAPTVIFAGRVDPANPLTSIWSFTRGAPVLLNAQGQPIEGEPAEGEGSETVTTTENPADGDVEAPVSAPAAIDPASIPVEAMAAQAQARTTKANGKAVQQPIQA